ncbi:MAG: DUF5597 domain-containing protein [Anaerolineae bacterium]|nr:DUF5597 domain-containing protein [Anaerolineae bacterium]
MTNRKPIFQVQGAPFYPVGGQAHNSSGYSAEEAETAFRAVLALHGNTLEIPVYWEQVEPQEGHYDFGSVDALLESARRHDLHLILLWFGTWKNGSMEYTPAWVKDNPERFERVVSPGGSDLWVLSSHCEAAFEADRRAFTALCRHLRDRDGATGTVIALQIENEPGILGADRDYSAAGVVAMRSPVPPDVLELASAERGGALHDLWLVEGSAAAGTWADLFGPAAGELMTAWSIARYIDGLAEAGKAVLDLPMIVNVWLGEAGWRIPGETYPSGGAVLRTLDLWKGCAPHVDLIAPDIYYGDSRGYEAICAGYARPDNPLFVPESAPWGPNAVNLFRAAAQYGAIGYFIFGVESILTPEGAVSEAARPVAESMRCLAAAAPLLLTCNDGEGLHAVIQEEHLASQALSFEGYSGLAVFEGVPGHPRPTDWRHRAREAAMRQAASSPAVRPVGDRGRGLVAQVDEHEFFLVGAGYRLLFRRQIEPERALDASMARDQFLTKLAHYVRVDEGHFDEQGRFVVDRRRNGDETDGGVWVAPDVGVVHVVLCD